MKSNEIQMRDPYVLPEDGRYYLVGTTDADCWHGHPAGFEAYTSDDLIDFTPQGTIFTPSDTFWGTENFWAPELHVYQDGYYLFATFKAPGLRRGTSILRAPGPLGSFVPHGARTVTPEDWECLDGTLFVDAGGTPWVVFCHEWVQIGDGTVCARRLTEDLSGAEGEAVTLFHASEAPWTKRVKHSSGVQGYVTDGPFLYRPASGRLWMLWSSLSETGYAIGLAISESGSVLGPWRQQDAPIYSGDGGHGMLFRDFASQLRLAIHTPNKTPNERPIFLPVTETEDGLTVLA